MENERDNECSTERKRAIKERPDVYIGKQFMSDTMMAMKFMSKQIARGKEKQKIFL